MTQPRKPSLLARGFSLIEMIAVLAIIAILASAIAPNIASQLKRARSDAEDMSLVNLSKLLTESVERNRSIPGAAGWDLAISAYSSQPQNLITTNEDNFARVYVIDPGWLPVASRPPAAGWTQTPTTAWAMAGSTPTKCRILLFSGAQSVPACAGLTGVQFDAVWNGAGGPAACMEGVNLRLVRINLIPLFHQVTLHAAAGANPSFTFDGNTVAGFRHLFPAGTTTTFPVLNGTRLSLLDASATPALQTEIVVNQALSASWNGATWTIP